MSKVILALLSLTVLAPTAKAGQYLDHEATKGTVRLSLWYEGTESYEKSMFRPGAAEALIQEVAQAPENTNQISEELAVALDRLDS